jgi:hypothetical protein
VGGGAVNSESMKLGSASLRFDFEAIHTRFLRPGERWDFSLGPAPDHMTQPKSFGMKIRMTAVVEWTEWNGRPCPSTLIAKMAEVGTSFEAEIRDGEIVLRPRQEAAAKP